MRHFTDQQRRDFLERCQRIDTDLAQKKQRDDCDGPRNCRIGSDLKHIKDHYHYELDGYDQDDKGDPFFRWVKDRRNLGAHQAGRYLKCAALAHLVTGRAPVQALAVIHDAPPWLWAALVEAVAAGAPTGRVVVAREYGKRRWREGYSKEKAAEEAKKAALGLIRPLRHRIEKTVKQGREVLDQIKPAWRARKKLVAVRRAKPDDMAGAAMELVEPNMHPM